MGERDPGGGQCWESGWEGHARAQRRRLARLSLREKLEWLEEAHRLVLHLECSRPQSDAQGQERPGSAEGRSG
jgi:hypothetical protein